MIANPEIQMLLDNYKDFIHDTAFNFYGTRMATGSSDGYVRVYDLHDGDKWHQTGNFSSPHQPGPVIKVAWAHPEFGGILATISYDRFVYIWDEVPIGPNEQSEYATRWSNREQFFDSFLFSSTSESRSSGADANAHGSAYNASAIQFAPKHLGLVLATSFFDGRVRIYDLQGPNVMNKDEIQTRLSNLSTISWSTARNLLPLLAVGSDDCNTGIGPKLQLWEYFQEGKMMKVDISSISMFVQNPVKDIQFAPNFGQSYHLLAIASNDIDIFTIKPAKNEHNSSAENKAQSYDIRRIVTLDGHGSTVWKVCWNVFGSVLYSCGDDARIRLWKGSINGPWKCESSVSLQPEALERMKAEAKQSATDSVVN